MSEKDVVISTDTVIYGDILLLREINVILYFTALNQNHTIYSTCTLLFAPAGIVNSLLPHFSNVLFLCSSSRDLCPNTIPYAHQGARKSKNTATPHQYRISTASCLFFVFGTVFWNGKRALFILLFTIFELDNLTRNSNMNLLLFCSSLLASWDVYWS